MGACSGKHQSQNKNARSVLANNTKQDSGGNNNKIKGSDDLNGDLFAQLPSNNVKSQTSVPHGEQEQKKLSFESPVKNKQQMVQISPADTVSTRYTDGSPQYETGSHAHSHSHSAGNDKNDIIISRQNASPSNHSNSTTFYSPAEQQQSGEGENENNQQPPSNSKSLSQQYQQKTQSQNERLNQNQNENQNLSHQPLSAILEKIVEEEEVVQLARITEQFDELENNNKNIEAEVEEKQLEDADNKSLTDPNSDSTNLGQINLGMLVLEQEQELASARTIPQNQGQDIQSTTQSGAFDTRRSTQYVQANNMEMDLNSTLGGSIINSPISMHSVQLTEGELESQFHQLHNDNVNDDDWLTQTYTNVTSSIVDANGEKRKLPAISEEQSNVNTSIQSSGNSNCNSFVIDGGQNPKKQQLQQQMVHYSFFSNCSGCVPEVETSTQFYSGSGAGDLTARTNTNSKFQFRTS